MLNTIVSRISLLFVLLWGSAVWVTVSAQQSKTQERIKVYLDCQGCDTDYFRSEAKFLNFVRDPSDADLHAFVRSINAGAGDNFNFTYIAFDRLQHQHDTSQVFLESTLSSDERRSKLFDHFQWRILPYLVQVGQQSDFKLTYQGNELGVETEPLIDPWRSWIFELYGVGQIDKESSRSEFEIKTGLEADHLSDDWRIRIRLRSKYEFLEVMQKEQMVSNSNQTQSLSGIMVRSLGNHWSAGLSTTIYKSTYDNIRYSFYGGPAVEYSLFPYQQALKREITLAYRIGFTKNSYFETTIFDLLDEQFARHSLTVNARIRQPWGSLFSYVRASQILSDLDKNRISAYLRLNVRLIKGLSISISSSYDRIQDQISLPKGSASLEDLLLQTRRLATNYDLDFSLGLNYTFGSVYNNVVNTRL